MTRDQTTNGRVTRRLLFGIGVVAVVIVTWRYAKTRNSWHLRSTIITDVGQVEVLSLSPDGTVLAVVGSNDAAELWHLPTKRRLHAFEAVYRYGSELAFSPNGSFFAIGAANGIQLWDLRSLEPIAHSELQHTLLCFALSPDGRTLAGVGWRGGGRVALRLWDVDSGGQVGAFDCTHTSITYSPDGRWIATGSGWDEVDVFDLLARESRNLSSNGTGNVDEVCFSPDGTMLAAAGNDTGVTVWDVATWRKRGTAAVADSTWRVAFSPDGAHIVATGNQWHPKWWESLPFVKKCINKLGVELDGETGIVKVLDAITLETIATFEHTDGYPEVVDAIHTGNGLVVVTCPDGKRVRVWDVPL